MNVLRVVNLVRKGFENSIQKWRQLIYNATSIFVILCFCIVLLFSLQCMFLSTKRTLSYYFHYSENIYDSGTAGYSTGNLRYACVNSFDVKPKIQACKFSRKFSCRRQAIPDELAHCCSLSCWPFHLTTYSHATIPFNLRIPT